MARILLTGDKNKAIKYVSLARKLLDRTKLLLGGVLKEFLFPDATIRVQSLEGLDMIFIDGIQPSKVLYAMAVADVSSPWSSGFPSYTPVESLRWRIDSIDYQKGIVISHKDFRADFDVFYTPNLQRIKIRDGNAYVYSDSQKMRDYAPIGRLVAPSPPYDIWFISKRTGGVWFSGLASGESGSTYSISRSNGSLFVAGVVGRVEADTVENYLPNGIVSKLNDTTGNPDWSIEYPYGRVDFPLPSTDFWYSYNAYPTKIIAKDDKVFIGLVGTAPITMKYGFTRPYPQYPAYDDEWAVKCLRQSDGFELWSKSLYDEYTDPIDGVSTLWAGGIPIDMFATTSSIITCGIREHFDAGSYYQYGRIESRSIIDGEVVWEHDITTTSPLEVMMVDWVYVHGQYVYSQITYYADYTTSTYTRAIMVRSLSDGVEIDHFAISGIESSIAVTPDGGIVVVRVDGKYKYRKYIPIKNGIVDGSIAWTSKESLAYYDTD